MTLAEAVQGREREFPLLARALADARRMVNPRVEWLVVTDGDGLGVDFNYAQIFRTVSSPLDHDGYPQQDDQGSRDALAGMLGSVDYMLEHGQRTVTELYRGMGGAMELLGRLPEDGDDFSLWILRDLRYRVIDIGRFPEDAPLDYPYAEWLCEVSLQAKARSEASALHA